MSDLILAFDDSCNRCSRLSKRIEEVTQGSLKTRPLRDPSIHDLRHDVFGDNPPWKPTLFRVADDTAKGWVGPRMGPVLVGSLGASKSTQVLKVLGIENMTRGIKQPLEPLAKTVSRRGAMQLGAGLLGGAALALGSGLLRPTPSAAARAQASVSPLGASAAQESFERLLASVDVNNILHASLMEDLEQATIIEAPELREGLYFARYAAEGSTTYGDKTISGQGHVLSITGGHQDDTDLTNVTVFFQGSPSQMVTFQHSAGESSTSQAELFEVDEDMTTTTLAASDNGVLSEPVPDSSDNASTRNDPCGACLDSTNRYQTRACNNSDARACVLAWGTCTGCASSCLTTGPLCLVCITGTCWSTFAYCCEETSPGICRLCID